MTAPLADSHLHLFSRGFPGRYGRSVLGHDSEIEAYEALRHAHDIAAGLVVGYEGDGIDPDNNHHISTLAANRPWLATLAYADSRKPLGADAIERWIAAGHVGIAVYLPDSAASESVASWPRAVWNSLERRRAIVSLNAQPPQIESFAPVVEAHPGCSFLFSHLGLPGRYPSPPTPGEAADCLRPLLRLADASQAMVKVSGLYAVSDPAHAYPHAAAAPFIDLLLERFGAERCLWGSDFSPALDFVSFAQTVSIPWLDRLSEADRERVMGGNLLRLLNRP